MVARGNLTRSGVAGGVWKSWCVHSARRTRANASLNVGSGFERQLAARGADAALAHRSCAHRVTRENSPSSAGVVLRFGQGGLDRPAPDEPAQDVDRVRVKPGAQGRLGAKLAFDIADQHVADRHKAARVACRLPITPARWRQAGGAQAG